MVALLSLLGSLNHSIRSLLRRCCFASCAPVAIVVVVVLSLLFNQRSVPPTRATSSIPGYATEGDGMIFRTILS
jgi:hypothetical protein